MLYFSLFFHLRGLCIDTQAHQKDYNFVLCWGTGVKNVFSIDFLCRFIEKQVLFFHLRGSVFCAFVGTHLIALCFLTDKDLCASL